MSTIGWTYSVKASSVLDKVQQTQQSQDELAQAQAKAKALQEERLRRTTVINTPESEKIRLKEERERKKEEERKKKQGKEDIKGEDNISHDEDEEGRRKINIKV